MIVIINDMDFNITTMKELEISEENTKPAANRR